MWSWGMSTGSLSIMERVAQLLRQGEALLEQGRHGEAIACLRQALQLAPDHPDTLYILGDALHQAGRCEEAVAVFEKLLEADPAHVPAKLALGGALIDARRPAAAEIPLRRALAQAPPSRLRAAIHTNLALALRRQRKDQEALENYESARLLDPAIPGLDIHRAEALQNLRRYDEALAAFRAALARDPRDPRTHQLYNDLLYRLGRSEDYLKSYDRVPATRDLQRDKAGFLAHALRGAEALDIYRKLLDDDPYDRSAAMGAARALRLLKRHDEAMAVLHAALLRRHGDVALLRSAAETAIEQGDAKKALQLCTQGLAAARYDQGCLAAMGTALRILADERDEQLNGYDSLIQVIELKVPEGFSRFEDFNAELCAALGRMHPNTREYVNQSLRGGTQTPDHLFGTGHALVERLERRIAEALQAYIAALKEEDAHPFLSRRARRFQYAGSWSSLLRDNGFHVNHIHPEGWISSCYYAAVPEAVQDETARQGWIKFGEPSFDVALPARRAVQPVAGQLVLFPSYMWHGTNPFHDAAPRTTVAFDVVPL
jgi:tetratricopeptide (TPR) repeat protein